MLERECQIVDIKLSATSETKSEETISLFKKINELEATIKSCVEKIELVHNGIAMNVIKTPEKEDEIKRIYTPRLEHFNNKLKKR